LKNYRKYEVWEGYWCFEPIEAVQLNLLKTLDYYSWKPRENDKINIRIESFNNVEFPTKKQIETFEFVIENQSQIMESIWEYYNNLILPIYRTATDIEEEEIANSKSELSKVLGIKAIEIAPIDDTDSLYFLIEFDFRYDSEHGLYLLFKNETPIDLFSEGNKNYDAIDIYENGLYNENMPPLKTSICNLNGQSILRGEFEFKEQIKFKLLKGAYRVYYYVNNSERIRNFIVTENMENFTLEYVFKNCVEK
jgi:hypothetical protein